MTLKERADAITAKIVKYRQLEIMHKVDAKKLRAMKKEIHLMQDEYLTAAQESVK